MSNVVVSIFNFHRKFSVLTKKNIDDDLGHRKCIKKIHNNNLSSTDSIQEVSICLVLHMYTLIMIRSQSAGFLSMP